MKRIAVRRMVVVAVLAIVLAVFFLTPVVYQTMRESPQASVVG
ncbi:MAG: hypothetical protein ABSB56_06425 [Nitrososphaerales archaeon]